MYDASKKHPRHNEQSELARIIESGGWGALGGAFSGPTHALIGGANGAASQGLGDLLLGQPEEHSFGAEAGRGALGGAITGAGIGTVAVGKMKGGLNLIKHLMQKGMSHKGALALVLGSGALGGAAVNSGSQALNAGLSNWVTEDALGGKDLERELRKHK